MRGDAVVLGNAHATPEDVPGRGPCLHGEGAGVDYADASVGADVGPGVEPLLALWSLYRIVWSDIDTSGSQTTTNQKTTQTLT